MNTLFLRIYLSALAFLLVTFFVVLFIANNFIFKDLLSDSSQQIYQHISQSLSNKNQNIWHREIKIYNALVTDYTLSIVTADEITKEEKRQLLQASNRGVISDNIIGRADLYALYTLPNSNWILKIDEDNDSGDEVADMTESIISFLLLMLPLAFALFLLVKKLTKPIQHLTTVAEKLGQGDLNIRADNNLLPPMNTLASGFNTMADELNETLKEQRILVGAIPHELRSPLGRIRFALDMTRSCTTLEALRKDIERIDGYADEMENTVNEILELNRLQNQSQLETTSFEICHLLEALVAQQSQKRPDVPMLEWEVDCNTPLSVTGNAPLIKRAISNIISNAQRHAKSTIKIKLSKEEGENVLHIDDDGTGIADEQLEQIFAPFSTLDDSRSRKVTGVGLGLAIVKLIMKQHQGKVIASRSDLGGARFELRW